MSFVLPLIRATVRKNRPVWLTALGWSIASVASIALALASMPAAGWQTGLASLASLMPLSVVSPPGRRADTDDIDHRNPVRCRNCGIVEQVRTLPLAGAQHPAYELTVRFRDGSRRLSNHADDAGWRVGDSIMLMGGAKLADRR